MRTFILILSFSIGAYDNSAAASDATCNDEVRGYSPYEASANKSFDPPPGDRPAPIDIGFHLTSLSDIDVISGRFRFDGYAEFRWCDPRMAFDAESEGRSKHVFFGQDALRARNSMWIPDISIANSIGSVASKAQRVEVDSDGAVRITGFFSSIVAARFDLRRFPFDRQSLLISMESFTFNRDVVQLRPVASLVGYEESLYLPEWRVESVSLLSEEAGQVRDRVPFSRLVFSVNIERETGYYLFKLSIPLLLIVMLSWSVFWMRKESLASRMRISSTAFLTIVAYQFAVSGSLPKVAYLTLMDKLMVVSFVLIALTALENMVAVLMVDRNPEGSQKLDQLSRWFFPLAYLTSIASVALLAN